MEREEAMTKGLDDALRPLTEKGAERTVRMARFLKEHEDDFQVLVTSPLLRAKQTAACIREVIPFSQSYQCSELVPQAPPQAFAKWVQATVLRATHVVAVGHEPQLSTLASWLLGGREETFIDLKKSGIVALELESFDHFGPQSALLKWLVPPKLV